MQKGGGGHRGGDLGGGDDGGGGGIELDEKDECMSYVCVSR